MEFYDVSKLSKFLTNQFTAADTDFRMVWHVKISGAFSIYSKWEGCIIHIIAFVLSIVDKLRPSILMLLL